jgi:hypothetical protein
VNASGTATDRLPATDWRSRVAPHPFLGYSARPGISITEGMSSDVVSRMLGPKPPPGNHADWAACRANRLGFFSQGEYPLDCGDSDCVTAIFGGSLAQWCAIQGGARLESALRDAGYAKRPRVINAAFHGHKQPQSCITFCLLKLMGQRIDVAILIDGFNDVALASRNASLGYWYLAPSMPYLMAVLGEERVEWIKRRASDASASDMVKAWLVASRLMAAMSHCEGIRFVHVLQPNQYYSKKPFTDFERQHCLSSTSPYRSAVQSFYPLLREAGSGLRECGVDFLDAVDVFDEISETVYADNCCHLNTLGNTILANRIALHMNSATHSSSAQVRHVWRDKWRVTRPIMGVKAWLARKLARKSVSDSADEVYPLW